MNYRQQIYKKKTKELTKEYLERMNELKLKKAQPGNLDLDDLYLKIDQCTKELYERGFRNHELSFIQNDLLTCVICESHNIRKCNKCKDFICECGHHTEFFKNGGKEWKVFGKEGYCNGDCLHKKESTKVVDRKENFITIKTTCLSCGYYHFADLRRAS